MGGTIRSKSGSSAKAKAQWFATWIARTPWAAVSEELYSKLTHFLSAVDAVSLVQAGRTPHRFARFVVAYCVAPKDAVDRKPQRILSLVYFQLGCSISISITMALLAREPTCKAGNWGHICTVSLQIL